MKKYIIRQLRINCKISREICDNCWKKQQLVLNQRKSLGNHENRDLKDINDLPTNKILLTCKNSTKTINEIFIGCVECVNEFRNENSKAKYEFGELYP
jgi:hypothetical protein